MNFAARILGVVLGVSGTSAQLAPDSPVDCGLAISLAEVGEISPGNLNAPVPIGKDLYLIDQRQGKIYLDAKAKGNPIQIFDISTDGHDGLTFGFPDVITEYVSNVSPGPSDDEIYVGFQSTTLPDGLVPYGTGDLPAPIVEAHSGGYTGTVPASEPVDLYRVGELESCAAYCCMCGGPTLDDGVFPTGDTNTIYRK